MATWVIVHTIAILAACRLTRLVTTDTITAGLRARADRLAIDHDWGRYITELLHCPWCIGYWISLAAACWATFHAPVPRVDPITGALALSLTYSLIVAVTVKWLDRR